MLKPRRTARSPRQQSTAFLYVIDPTQISLFPVSFLIRKRAYVCRRSSRSSSIHTEARTGVCWEPATFILGFYLTAQIKANTFHGISIMTCIVANVGKHELMLLFSVICAYCAKEFGSVVLRFL